MTDWEKVVVMAYTGVAMVQGDKIPRTTAQQKGYNGFTGTHYQKPEVIRSRNFYTIHLKQAARENGILEPWSGAASLMVLFIYKTPVKKQHGAAKLTRPDCDNSVKLIQDCIMDAGILADDSQIYDLQVAKVWGPENRVDITVRLWE